MKTTINNKIRTIVKNGSYYKKPYNESVSDIQKNMGFKQYTYRINVADNIFNFIHKTGDFKLKLKDVNWRIFWDKLEDIPIDMEGCIEESFEHFDIGTENIEIWNWFEWFFDIQLGGNF